MPSLLSKNKTLRKAVKKHAKLDITFGNLLQF